MKYQDKLCCCVPRNMEEHKNLLKTEWCIYYKGRRHRCDKGNACGFAHYKSDFGKPRPPKAQQKAYCAQWKQFKTCSFGAKCQYRHVSEVASPSTLEVTCPKAEPAEAKPPEDDPPEAEPALTSSSLSSSHCAEASPPMAEPAEAQPPEDDPPEAQPALTSSSLSSSHCAEASPPMAEPAEAQPPEAATSSSSPSSSHWTRGSPPEDVSAEAECPKAATSPSSSSSCRADNTRNGQMPWLHVEDMTWLLAF